MVGKVSELCLWVYLAQSLDNVVLKDESLVGYIVATAFLAMTDITTVKEPCVVLVVRRLMGANELRNI